MTIPVIFKLEPGGDVLAVFPAMAGTYDPHTCGCYAHLGQHSSADVSYAAALPPARPHQFANLAAELERIGYDDLKRVRRFTDAHLKARRAQIAR